MACDGPIVPCVKCKRVLETTNLCIRARVRARAWLGLGRFRSAEGLDAKGKKNKMKKKEAKMAAAAYAALTDEDWCTTQVHECAMLLGEWAV